MIVNYCATCGIQLSNKRGRYRPKYCIPHRINSLAWQNGVSKTWFKEGQAPFNKGMTYSLGEKSPQWKGDKVGYWGLHDWVTRHLGRPMVCEFCGTDNPGKRYEWANKSGQYKRDLTDWVRLCKKCHNDLDGVNVLQNKKKANGFLGEK